MLLPVVTPILLITSPIAMEMPFSLRLIPLLVLGSTSSAFTETWFCDFYSCIFQSSNSFLLIYNFICFYVCTCDAFALINTGLCAHKYSLSWSHVLLELPILFALFLQNPASQKSCPCFISSTSTHSVYGLCQ